MKTAFFYASKKMAKNKETSLYRHYDRDGLLLYVGISISSIHRFTAHKNKSLWHSKAVKMTTEFFPDRETALIKETEAIIKEFPLYNIAKQPRGSTFKLRKEKQLNLINGVGDNDKSYFSNIKNTTDMEFFFRKMELKNQIRLLERAEKHNISVYCV